MSQGLSGKWLEVVPLVLAGVAFAVWQLRDVNREMERSRAERRAREARESKEAGAADAADAAADATAAPKQEPPS